MFLQFYPRYQEQVPGSILDTMNRVLVLTKYYEQVSGSIL